MSRKSLFEIYPQYDPRGGDSPSGPSGRSGAVPAHVAGKHRQHYPILPAATPQSGQTGMPSSEFSVMASRFMQNNTMNHDDIEYWASIADNPPYDVDRQYTYSGMGITAGLADSAEEILPDVPDDDWRDLDEDLHESAFRRLPYYFHGEASKRPSISDWRPVWFAHRPKDAAWFAREHGHHDSNPTIFVAKVSFKNAASTSDLTRIARSLDKDDSIIWKYYGSDADWLYERDVLEQLEAEGFDAWQDWDILENDEIEALVVWHPGQIEWVDRIELDSKSDSISLDGHKGIESYISEISYPFDMDSVKDGTKTGSARRAFALELLDEDEEELAKPEVEEVSTTANVRGYTAPLGTSPAVPGAGKKKKPHWQAYADSFGRAKPVD